jgi:hypothetical protein
MPPTNPNAMALSFETPETHKNELKLSFGTSKSTRVNEAIVKVLSAGGITILQQTVLPSSKRGGQNLFNPASIPKLCEGKWLDQMFLGGAASIGSALLLFTFFRRKKPPNPVGKQKAK